MMTVRTSNRGMQTLVLATGLTLALGTLQALAVCATPATQLAGINLSNALSLKTVCVGTGAVKINQEYHAGTGGGSIIDYKQGPTDARDPTKTIGSWFLSGNTVTYNYLGGGGFSYTVWQQTNGTYDFCNGTTPVVSGATILAGQVPCP